MHRGNDAPHARLRLYNTPAADISDVSCKHGEVAKSVFERYRLHTYQEAGYKPFVIAAMIFNSKIRDAAAKLKSFL